MWSSSAERIRVGGRWQWLLYAAALCFVTWGYWRAPPFTPDSWVYYELSKSIWGDFYRVSYLRSFVADTVYSSGFPPLWPLLWSVADKLTGLGAHAGLLLGAALVGAIGWVSERIGRALTGRAWVGLAAWLVTLLHKGLWQEFTAARSIPLSLLLIGLLLLSGPWLERRKVPAAAVSGVLLGAIVMTRFDLVLFAIAFTAGIYVITRSWLRIAVHVAAFLATISPWIVYSKNRFGTLFASDNGAAAWAIDPAAHLTDWHPISAATLSDSPLAWAGKMLWNALDYPLELLGSPDVSGVTGFLVVVAGLIVYRTSARDVLRDWRRYRNESWKWFALTGVSLLCTLPQYIPIHAYHGRYYSGHFWLLCLALVALLALAVEHADGKVKAARRMTIAFIWLVAVVLLPRAIVARVTSEDAQFPEIAGYPALKACLDSAGLRPDERVLISDHTFAARLAAVHGLSTAGFPRNMERHPFDGATTAQFLRQYRLRYAAGDAKAIEAVIPADLRTPIPRECGLALYRLSWPGD